jgi:lycopene beta-cyclase
MTYFGFLAVFVGIPIVVLLIIAWLDRRQGRAIPGLFGAAAPGAMILLHILIALIYTTPWDNYLVATSVWWYDPNLVTGFTIGWVPIEEYTFFVVQPILTSLWLLLLLRRWPASRWPAPQNDTTENGRFPYLPFTLMALLWLAMVAILAFGWQPGTYLALALGWALPPMMLQVAFGFHTLWRYRRLVFLAIAVPTLYLSAADSLAINSGTWTIDPAQSLNIYLGGVLPIEEFVFFLITNVLLVFGMTLALSVESQPRLNAMREQLARISRSLQGETVASSE